MHTLASSTLAKEHLRKRYRPVLVRLLFVGEAPPTSGRFFYQADSGLYRAIRDTFVGALPQLAGANFLESFRDMGCYLVDLCGRPVDRLRPALRRRVCIDGERRLGRIIKQLRPRVIVTVVRSIAANVTRAQQLAAWKGTHAQLPYPGRWQHHRLVFKEELTPILHTEIDSD